MGKISQVSSKYIIHATIEIDGIVDRPDVIGAIFGQTEGLLGEELELRELQRSGRIGRIEVNIDTRSGKSNGQIIIPSSLDKAETSIIGASLEIIQRIGPCNAKIAVQKVEDVRVSKRAYVIDRAKELLRLMIDTTAPDSQEISEEVAHSVRTMEVRDYGREKLPAGPDIEDAEEIIILEGRADVLALLKHGFRNVIAMNGTNVPKTIIELSKKKTTTAFVDGDRGGDLIIKELLHVAELDFITKARDGKEVEELTKKEIHKALRAKIAAEQAKLEFTEPKNTLKRQIGQSPKQPYQKRDSRDTRQNNRDQRRPQQAPAQQSKKVSEDEKKKFSGILEDLVGSRAATMMDNKLNILGKVPLSELSGTLKSIDSGVYAVIFDGVIDRDLVRVMEKSNVSHVVGMSSRADKKVTKINLMTADDL